MQLIVFHKLLTNNIRRWRKIENREVYEARAEVAKALSHPLRLQIIDILSEQDDSCVQDLTEKLPASQSSISKHLKILKQAGIIRRRKEGLKNFYSLQAPCVTGFFDCLDEVLKIDFQDKKEKLDMS